MARPLKCEKIRVNIKNIKKFIRNNTKNLLLINASEVPIPRPLKEDKSKKDGKAEGGKDFHRLTVYGKKWDPYRSMSGLHTYTQNSLSFSCAAGASLVELLFYGFMSPLKMNSSYHNYNNKDNDNHSVVNP